MKRSKALHIRELPISLFLQLLYTIGIILFNYYYNINIKYNKYTYN